MGKGYLHIGAVATSLEVFAQALHCLCNATFRTSMLSARRSTLLRKSMIDMSGRNQPLQHRLRVRAWYTLRSLALRQFGAMKIICSPSFWPLLNCEKKSAMTPASDFEFEQKYFELAGAPPQSCTCFSASDESTIATRSPGASALPQN